MATTTSNSSPNIFPFLRYQDAPTAIDWLVSAFGFEKQLVVPGPDDTIAHAQLRLGSGVVMLGSVRDDFLGVKSPLDLGAVNQGIYIFIEQVDAHYEQATAAGAEILMELQDLEHGSREYAARDPEGNLWCFGTYLPGAE